MVLDTKLNKLIKYEIIELTPLETQIIGILSDNEYYTMEEISRYIGFPKNCELSKETLYRLKEKYELLRTRSHKGTTLYKLKDKILIK